MLAGDGTGSHLHGIIPQAASFNTALLPTSPGWQRIDVIGAAIQQIDEAKEIPPTLVVLNNRDWWNIRRTKDSFGRYSLGDPSSPESRRIWDLDVVPTQNISSGTFLVGSGDIAACEIRDRMDTTISISTEHSDFFTKNLVAVLCEARLAILVLKEGRSFTAI
jgi:HK97 family phage major capsid protein